MSAKGFEGSSNDTVFDVSCIFSWTREVHRCLVFFSWSPIHVFPQKLALLILVKTLEISFISHTIHVHLPTFNFC